ncbi:MAG TPA: hypothetical protein VM779_16235 [Thermoanaerobaculia bacterium]|nr:hypothetical protein [Thermoanaerobaculia bacterium]
MQYLREAKVVRVEKKSLGGVTNARKVVIENDGIRAHTIFRAVHEIYRNARWDNGLFTPYLRDSYQNELAAHELSRLLGFDHVPPTIPWKLGRTKGALQLWIEKAEPGYREDEQRRPADPEAFLKERDTMRVFDALIENIDRNAGNMLIDSNGRVWWIDHTRSFGQSRDLHGGESIGRCARRFYERLKSTDPAVIRERLSPFLGRYEIEALLVRRLKLIALIEQRITDYGEENVLF